MLAATIGGPSPHCRLLAIVPCWAGAPAWADCFANFSVCQPGSGYESDSGTSSLLHPLWVW